MGELLRGLGARVRALWPGGAATIDPGAGADDRDRRLDVLEQDLRTIEARLRLLEFQSDPRGWNRHADRS